MKTNLAFHLWCPSLFS